MKSRCLVLACCCWLAWLSSTLADFSTIINVPPQTAPASIGSDTQLNLFAGGSIPADFAAGAVDGSSTNVEVNITGGVVGPRFYSYEGATVNVSGGTIGLRFWPHGGITNITGGIFGPNVTFEIGSVANIAGGVFDYEVHAMFRSAVNVSGGQIAYFQVHEEGEASFFGTQFFLDGVEMTDLVPGMPMVIHERDVSFSGTLADGSPFDFELISAHPNQGGADVDHFAHEAILTVTLVPPADFDNDFDVDADDLAEWEAAYGVNDLADADGDGDSDGADFLAWQSQYTGPAGELSAAVSVPEPAAGMLLMVCVMSPLGGRRRPTRPHSPRVC
jgi:hypothetical protein